MKAILASSTKITVIVLILVSIAGCSGGSSSGSNSVNNGGPAFTIENTLSEEAQRNTIAFDALSFLTGNLEADSLETPSSRFSPPPNLC